MMTTDNVTVKDDVLTITNMQKQQENIYSCTVSNRMGTITRSSLVKVYGKNQFVFIFLCIQVFE